jgi:hypothetical protein
MLGLAFVYDDSLLTKKKVLYWVEADQNSINSKAFSLHFQYQITVKSTEKGEIRGMKHMDKAHYYTSIL